MLKSCIVRKFVLYLPLLKGVKKRDTDCGIPHQYGRKTDSFCYTSP